MRVSFEGRVVEGSDSPASIWVGLCAGSLCLSLGSNTFAVVRGASGTKLSALEQLALERCAGGAMSKQVAIELGVTPARCSRLLSSAASKLGLSSSVDALRLVGGLLGARSVGLDTLTGAERGVVGLVKRGLSNQQIAAARTTSPRTVANQVAAVLQKTGLASRRAIVACACG